MCRSTSHASSMSASCKQLSRSMRGPLSDNRCHYDLSAVVSCEAGGGALICVAKPQRPVRLAPKIAARISLIPQEQDTLRRQFFAGTDAGKEAQEVAKA